MTLCQSCISSYKLYNSGCYSSCPAGSYSKSNNGVDSCKDIGDPVSIVPVTFTSIAAFIIVLLIRVYSNKKIGNQSKSKRRYSVGSNQPLQATTVSIGNEED